MRSLAVLACGLFIVPTLAQGGGPVPDARALGIMEALLAYCSKSVPLAAEKRQDQVKLMTQGTSEEALAKVRHSAEYRQAYDAESAFAGNVDERNARRFCSGSLPRNK
jgi:hypothetical protein